MMTRKINPSHVKAVREYINSTWDRLTFTFADFIIHNANTKTKNISITPPTICIPPTDDFQKAYNNIRDQVPASLFSKIRIEPLTKNHIHSNPNAMLYLPHPYIIPGGRFNEMYGWDSFFIILGLLKDHRYEMAKNMANNLLYEVQHYGKMLNANRCYYLTRSQPPIISEAVLAVYHYKQDDEWLKQALPNLEKFHNYWTTDQRLIESIGLSRYYAESNKPLPDVEAGYHEHVMDFYRNNRITCYDVNRFYDAKKKCLKPAFFRADRTVRESGFDLSNKFGPFGADILNHAPVSINSLLCQTENNIASIYQILGNKTKTKQWQQRAKKRAKLINYYCWEPDLGYYFDYNYKKKDNRLYIYATTFYPLMAGITPPQEAARVIRNLPILESHGGIMSSAYVTGMQWDAPFGWAPHQLFTIEALYRYNAQEDAKRIATKYISMINNDFQRTGAIFEKYDMVKCTSDVVENIRYGYKTNAAGFGWTNAVYLYLLDYIR